MQWAGGAVGGDPAQTQGPGGIEANGRIAQKGGGHSGWGGHDSPGWSCRVFRGLNCAVFRGIEGGPSQICRVSDG